MNTAYSKLAALYDGFMYDVDYSAWADYIDGFLKEANARRVLEAGCGTGRLTVLLARRGYELTATDVSPEMLGVAAENARKAGVRPRFIAQDMRSLAVGNPVDAVVCAMDGANYIDAGGLRAFARSACAALKKGGLLLFDVSSEYKLASVVGNNLFYDDGDDATYIWQNSYLHDPERVIMNIALFVREGGIYRRADEKHTQYLHSEASVLSALAEAGFAQTAAYAFGTREKAGEGCERLQFVARK